MKFEVSLSKLGNPSRGQRMPEMVTFDICQLH